MDGAIAVYSLGSLAALASVAKLKSRIDLSRAKHPSLGGHSRLASRIARLLPFYEYDEDVFFRSDDAPEEVAARRRAGFDRLARLYRERFPETTRLTAEVEDA